MGYRISTPKNVILDETELTSIKDRALYLGYNHVTKVLSNISIPANKQIEQFFKTHKNSKRKKRSLIQVCIEKVKAVTHDLLICSDKLQIYKMPHTILYQASLVNLELGRFINQCCDPDLLFDLIFLQGNIRRLFADGSVDKDSPSVGSACYIE